MTDQTQPFDEAAFDDDQGLVEQTIRDLGTLADVAVTPAEANLILNRLSGSPALEEILRLIGRGLSAVDDDDLSNDDWDVEFDALDDDLITFLPVDSDLNHATSSPFTETLVTLRQQDTQMAISAVGALTRQPSRRGAVALIVDGGGWGAREQIAQQIATALAGETGEVLRLDASQENPDLWTIDPDERQISDSTPVTILDGDLAPRLSDLVQRDGQAAYAVIAPDTTLSALAAILQPDLIIGLTPPTATRLIDPRDDDDDTQALRQVLELDGPASVRFRLPEGDRLVNAIVRYVDTAASTPTERAFEVLRLLRRLSLGPRAAETRRALAELNNLDQRFAVTESTHALSWSALYRDAGLTAEAVNVLDRALPRWPNDVRLRHMHANLDVLRGRERSAIQMLNDLPASPHVMHAQARAYRRAGDLQQASNLVLRGLTETPDNVYLLIEAGIIATWQRSYREADGYFARAHTLMPAAGAVLNAWGRAVAESGWAERAERLLARAAALEPWNERHPLEIAQLLSSRGMMTSAADLLRPLLGSATIPVRRRATLKLIDILLQTDKPTLRDEAEALLTSFEAELPEDERGSDDHIRAVSLRVQVFARRGETRPAIRAARQSIRSSPYLIAQQIAAKLGIASQYTSALADITELERTPKAAYFPPTQRVIATLRARLLVSGGDLDGARAAISAALLRDPNQPALLNTLADIERTLGRMDVAEALYRSSLAIDPANAFTHRGLSALLRDVGRFDEAEPYFRYVRLVGLDPQDRHDANEVIETLAVVD